MNINQSIYGLVIGGLLTVGTPAGVFAQEDGADASGLEEIVVTARRREENLQEVPIAITAFSAADLELRNIENIENLQVMLPNVDIRGNGTSGGNAGAMSIRGIPGVSRYLDGVHRSGGAGSLENVVELERIEVLRGPQGTYFGKNAIGGAIQYVTQKPQEEFGARVKVTMGDYDRQDLVVNVDIPLGDTVLTKITAANLYRDGHVDSVTINESYGEKDNTIFRGVLQWQPTESFEALFTAAHNRVEGNVQANVLFDVIEGYPGPQTPERYNAAGIPFTDEIYAFGKDEQYKNAVDFTGPGVFFDSDFWSMQLTWDLSDSLTLKSITANRETQYATYRDLDATQLVMQNTWYWSEGEETTQEFQLLGSGDRLNWVVGLYYFDDEGSTKFNGWQRYELTAPAGPGAPRLRNDLSAGSTTDTAIYAEATYDLTEKLTLTVGGRYSEEEFHTEILEPADALGLPTDPSYSLEGTLKTVDGVPLEFDVESDAFTPRVALQYQYSDTVMAYISYAEGFNGAGANSRFDPTLPNNGLLPYDSELLKNYELGVRTDLLNNRLRLNATYFFGIWEDIQIGESFTPGQTTITNGGEAEVEGIELEGMWRATDNISVNFTYGWLDTAYTELGASQTLVLDSPFPNAPEHSYSIGGQWDNDLSNGGSTTARFDYGWVDESETNRDPRFHVDSPSNAAHGLLSARIAYVSPDGNWDVALHGTNLTEEWYRMGGFSATLGGVDQGVVGRPREIGMTLGLRF